MKKAWQVKAAQTARGVALRTRRAWWALLFVSVCLGGCFSGEYNRRLSESIQKIQTEVRLHGSASPIVDPSTGATIRLPEMIGGDAQTLQVGGQGSDEAQPPFVDLPGFAYAYKFPAEGQTAYLYVATVPVAEKTADELAKQIQAAVRQEFSAAVWQETNVAAPDGPTLAVRRLSVEGPQAFGDQDLPGRFDLYLASTASHHILLGWRAPSSAGKFFEAAAASVGTLSGVSS